MQKLKKKKIINYQKKFCFISIIFIITCCVFYGSRAVYFYIASRKTIENEDKLLYQSIINSNDNSNNFKKINNEYYFYNDADNNYLLYSNIVFRIIKITENNEIMLISEDPIVSLAYGNNKTYKNSYITKWLNIKDSDTNTGILESNITNYKKYLTTNNTCIDTITSTKKITCNNTSKNNYFDLLSINDYINTGGKKSFINNGYITYLANNYNKKKNWYINSEGMIDNSSKNDIYTSKVVITIKSTISLIDGNGKIDNPYVIENKTNYFASYIKLDEDIFRVYKENDDTLTLVANNTIKVNDEDLEYKYSNNTYYHNDTIYGTSAYYLNHIYLNSLNYKDLIISNKYVNGIYGTDNNYSYQSLINNKIDTYIAMPSLDMPILSKADNYFIATGTLTDSDAIYLMKDKEILEIDVTDKAYLLPCITIKKNSITSGTGTEKDPYQT